MATAAARAMPSEAPLVPLPTNDAPAIAATRIAASPADVKTIALRARMARTRAAIAAPSSRSATMACAASVAKPKTRERNDLCTGSATYRFTATPSPNWMMSSTAAPMQLPRSAASRGTEVAAELSCWTEVISCLPCCDVIPASTPNSRYLRVRYQIICPAGGGRARLGARRTSWSATGRAGAADAADGSGAGLGPGGHSRPGPATSWELEVAGLAGIPVAGGQDLGDPFFGDDQVGDRGGLWPVAAAQRPAHPSSLGRVGHRGRAGRSEPERQRRAHVGGPAGPLFQPRRNRHVQHHRVALLIQLDEFGHDVRTQAVAPAAGPIDGQPDLTGNRGQRQVVADRPATAAAVHVRGEIIGENVQRGHHEPEGPVRVRARTAAPHSHRAAARGVQRRNAAGAVGDGG